jgi:hypothetical protein
MDSSHILNTSKLALGRIKQREMNIMLKNGEWKGYPAFMYLRNSTTQNSSFV